MMRRIYCLFLALLSLLLCTAANAQLTVSNIRAKQLPDRTVEVLYDLAGGSDDSCAIRLMISSDEGANFVITPKTISGAIGSDQKPGLNKRIIWVAEKDLPGRYGEQYRALVISGSFLEREVSLPGGGSITMVYIAQDTKYDSGINGGRVLPGYWIGKYEVTRGQYKRFIDAGGYNNQSNWSKAGWEWKTSVTRTQPDFWDNIQNWDYHTPQNPAEQFNQSDNHPVVGVCIYEAEAFCTWAHFTIPSYQLYQKAGFWNGQLMQTWPWAGKWNENYWNCFGDNYFKYTAPAGCYADISTYGCADMAGNVSELNSSCFTNSYPNGGNFWTNNSGSPANNDMVYLGTGYKTVGFRVVSTPL